MNHINSGRQKRRFSNLICNGCGYKGHRAADSKRPARGKICNICGMKDHFTKKCNTKRTGFFRKRVTPNFENRIQSKQIKTRTTETAKPQEIHYITQREDRRNLPIRTTSDSNDVNTMLRKEESDEDVFCVTTQDESNKIKCIIGGVITTAVIDSGSKHNLINEKS